MLGPLELRRLDEPVAVSLEDLVPADNFYRHLEAKLGLSFVRAWTREFFADRGRPSMDPVGFFTPQLMMFFEGIRSERKRIGTKIANTPARSVADPFTLSAKESTGSPSLPRLDPTPIPPNPRSQP